jgi:hypothetical protein
LLGSHKKRGDVLRIFVDRQLGKQLKTFLILLQLAVLHCQRVSQKCVAWISFEHRQDFF